MVFRRIIFSALLLGIVGGLLLSVVQFFTLNPIILAAEVFEVEEVARVSTGTPSHSHNHQPSVASGETQAAWAPEDGLERTVYSVIANISAGIGFAAILLAMMSQLQVGGITKLTIFKGFLWGVAGFTVFFVVPGLGLPPEIPGVEAAPVEHRQLWWALAVACSGAGLLVIAFSPIKFKALGVFALAIPFVVSAPHQEGPAFSHPDLSAIETLTTLHQQFFMFSGISNFLFWAVLGVTSAWALNRWVLNDVNPSDVTKNDVNSNVSAST